MLKKNKPQTPILGACGFILQVFLLRFFNILSQKSINYINLVYNSVKLFIFLIVN